MLYCWSCSLRLVTSATWTCSTSPTTVQTTNIGVLFYITAALLSWLNILCQCYSTSKYNYNFSFLHFKHTIFNPQFISRCTQWLIIPNSLHSLISQFVFLCTLLKTCISNEFLLRWRRPDMHILQSEQVEVDITMAALTRWSVIGAIISKLT